MGESEEGINILIKRAYIERLEFDIVDKIKIVWHDFLDVIAKGWDWLFDIPPSAESITDEEGAE